MNEVLKLPIGIENFEEIRTKAYYYIDKTRFIEQLLNDSGEVRIFTRPRRFGKTLNMSMLRYFFEIGTDASLFDGLYIAGKQALVSAHLGKYPVIFLSLKNVEGLSFESARYQLVELIAKEARRHRALESSPQLDEDDQKIYAALTQVQDGMYVMAEDVLYGSLQALSELLYKHYQQKVLILIEEYDVPLDKAFQHGYYREMVALMRTLF